MANIKYDKLQELIRMLAAEYFSRESNRQSLITVTGVDVFAHGTRAKILVTVLPESQQEAAVGFAHKIRPQDLAEVIDFDSRVVTLQSFTSNVPARTNVPPL